MPIFVDSSRVPVILDDHTIYIRAKMSARVRAEVQDEMRARGFGGGEEVEISGLGSYRLALLVHNIVAWEGPQFAGIPCTRENIQRMDMDDPLVELVAEEIGKRNAPRESPDPNSVTPTGSTEDGAAPSKARSKSGRSESTT